ncbi:MAG: O-antigen ligase domain-containing protein, partial [Pseudomonadota bacterium]
FVLSFYIGLPEKLFISPIQMVGGPGPEYFTLQLFSIDPSNGLPRWHFYSPWAPAAGFVACIHAVLSLDCTTRRQTAWIIASALLIAIFTKSRLALLALVATPPIAVVAFHLFQPLTAFILAGISPLAPIIGPWLIQSIDDGLQAFRSARVDSSRVREALGRIAMSRWEREAPTFGHGIVERGPHLVEYMPIGSHHTWYGLLFVKGTVGLLALAVPFAVTFLHLLWKAQRHMEARSAFLVITIILFYTFGENLEILAYLFWPGLVAVGTALKPTRQRVREPIP